MRAYTASLPILAAAILLTITTALDSEPPHESKPAETLMNTPTVQATFNAYLPRFTADLEGDLSPVLFVSNLEHDFPPFEPAPEPEPVQQAMVVAEPVRTPLPAISSVSTALSEEQMRGILAATWPIELHGQALAVACGIGNARWPSGESGCRPGAIGDQGRSWGLFQLNVATWAPYCGVSPETLLDAMGNASCAYQVYLYDIERGHEPWQQWSVKPW